jgi:hypothetical protein
LNRAPGNSNIEKQFIKGSLDLDDSYDDEKSMEVPFTTDNAAIKREYEDSDFEGEEGELVEGQLNSDQKKRLKHDLMAMGYEEEEDDLEDSPQEEKDFDA